MSDVHTPIAAAPSPAVTDLDLAPDPPASPADPRLRGQLSRFSGVLLLLLLILIFGLVRPETFLTMSNAKSILSAQAIVAIVAIGILFPMAAGAFDLSAAQNLGFSAVLCGSLMVKHEVPVPLAILITLAVGVVIGVINGTLVAVIGIDSFIATLGTTSLLLASSQFIASGDFLGPFPESFQGLTDKDVFGLPITTVYVAVIALVAWYVLERTPPGRRIYASGANSDAARLSGIHTSKLVFCSLVASATIASAAGILLASTLGAVSETIGPEYLLPAFASVFLGTTLLKTGRFNVPGTLLAIILLGTGVQGLQLLGGPNWVIALFNGVALIAAVGAGLTMRRVQDRRAIRKTARTSRAAGSRRSSSPPPG